MNTESQAQIYRWRAFAGLRRDPDVRVEPGRRVRVLTRLPEGVIFHRTMFDDAEYRSWPMAVGFQRNDPRVFLRAEGG